VKWDLELQKDCNLVLRTVVCRRDGLSE